MMNASAGATAVRPATAEVLLRRTDHPTAVGPGRQSAQVGDVAQDALSPVLASKSGQPLFGSNFNSRGLGLAGDCDEGPQRLLRGRVLDVNARAPRLRTFAVGVPKSRMRSTNRRSGYAQDASVATS